MQQNPFENYDLVIVGHSLGAAAAAILALTLRPRYPNLKCLGYGMPASVFDWRTAQGKNRKSEIEGIWLAHKAV